MTSTTLNSARHGTPEDNRNGDASSQGEGSPVFMTPKRKIGALLAEFDSDSDSGNERENTLNAGEKPSTTLAQAQTIQMQNNEKRTEIPNESDDDDYDDLPVAPRGRLAARMQDTSQAGQAPPPKSTENPDPRDPQLRKNPSNPEPLLSGTDSEDDINVPTTRKGRRNSVHSAPPSDTSRRSASPLFVPMGSPEPDIQEPAPGSGDEVEVEAPNRSTHPRLHELAAKKRREREAKEQEEAQKKAERMQRSSDLGLQFSSEDEDGNEDDAGRKLTQQSRPGRKAGKKAMLEMNRETQRISRNMQLAHQATTKKKISVNSFLARFNQSKNSSEAENPASASSHPPSDIEGREPRSTPPTSPLRNTNTGDDSTSANPGPQVNEVTEDATNHQEDKASDVELRTNSALAQEKRASNTPKETKANRRSIRVNLSREAVSQTENLDSDSDLEVVTSPSKSRQLAVFENLPLRNSHQSRSLQTLRALANLTAPNRNQTMTQGELDATLFRKARKQAAQEREEKINRLREKGVVIQTAEERTRTENDVEDLMEKAREEADNLAKKEKAAAKKEAEEADDNGELLYDDDSEEEYDEGQADGEHDSEDEEMESNDGQRRMFDGEASDEEIEEAGDNVSTGLVENQAQEAIESESDAGEIEADRSEPEQMVDNPSRRIGRSKFVVSDDEDDDHALDPDPITATPKPQPPSIGKPSSQFMGLSQAFAATLAESQDDTEQDSLAQLRRMPGMDFPEILEPDSQEIIRDSQDQESGSLDLLADYTQAGARVADSPSARTMTQYSQAPEPTQDAGFVMSPFDQEKRFREPPHSTVDTIPVEDTPLVKKGMRRLRRGQQAEQVPDEEEQVVTDRTAFDIMRKAAKKPHVPYDKSKSKAKDIVDEAAEESEDEYAGLGGASDEDSEDEQEYDREMINDDSGEVVDEKELAAYNANLSREKDEQDVNKLMKDITTGALRRKRGGGDDFDLSESEDERAESRRRAKRREFAKMRKALLTDEKLNKMADDPKKAAFLRSIEDRDPMGDNDFLANEYENNNTVDFDASQENGNEQESVTAAAGDKRKRPLGQTSDGALNRAKSRRKAAMKKPTSLAEIRQSVSFLLDGPDGSSSSSRPEDKDPQEQDDEDELGRPGTTVGRGLERSRNDSTNHNDGPAAFAGNQPRRNPADTFSNPRRTRGAVVDRLSLRRAASSNAKSAATGSKLAFHAETDSIGGSSFNGPAPLLSRRSTTASSTASKLSTGANNSGGAVKAEVTGAGVGGGKKAAAVNYYAAAREKVREMELKRKTEQRMERKLGLMSSMEKGERLQGLLGAEKSGQWD